MSNDKFLSKTNIYPTIWAIIVMLLAFFVGLFWKSINGPDEVVVLNRNNPKDTTITIIQFKPDQEYFENLNKLTSKTVKKQFANNQTTEKKKNVDSLTMAIAREYQMKFDSLSLSLMEPIKPKTNDNIFSSTTSELSNNSTIKRPKFNMPKAVGGYIESKINSYATVSLNANEFNRIDKVIATINFFNKSTLSKMTPLFVELVEIKSANSYNQIWSEQYDINTLKSIISFSADFKPGKYVLSLGFYHLDELNTKFPSLYSRKFDIEIK